MGPAVRPFRIPVHGRWAEAQVRSRAVPSTYAPPAACRAVIEAHWAQRMQESDRCLFDGRVARLEAVEVGHELVFALSETGYKQFLGTNGLHPEWGDDHGPQALATVLGSSAALRSADGALVFGVRSQRVALYPGLAHPFGGTLDWNEHEDVMGHLRRELAEECGLGPEDLAALTCLAVSEDPGLRQPEIIALADCRLTLAELARRLDTGEHKALWSVPAQAETLAEALHLDHLTAVTRATIWCYGYDTWGAGWAASVPGPEAVAPGFAVIQSPTEAQCCSAFT